MKITEISYIFELLNKKGVAYVFKNGTETIAWYTTHMFLSPIYLNTLKALPTKMSVKKVLDFANQGCNGAFKPLQVESEITNLLTYVQKLKPKVVVEIGTANGGTLLSLIKTSPSDTQFISIDLPGGAFGGGYAWYKIPLFKAFVSKKQTLELLREDSHQAETLEKLKTILNGKKIDFLLIDGDHTYQGVKQDFEMYSPLVRKNGAIAFHDIVIHKKIFNCGVSTLWKSLKKKFKHEEFVENWKQGFCGIGVIRKA